MKSTGKILVGLSVEGGKNGIIPLRKRIKKSIEQFLCAVGIDHRKDHHVCHPTYKELLKLIIDNGFEVEDVYWQPHWKDKVCYVCAKKKA